VASLLGNPLPSPPTWSSGFVDELSLERPPDFHQHRLPAGLLKHADSCAREILPIRSSTYNKPSRRALNVHISPATRRVIPPAVARTARAEIVIRAWAHVCLIARVLPSTGGVIARLHAKYVTAEVSGA
jgi:hypothetical protein